MLRTVVFALFGLVLCAGVGLTADTKKAHPQHGVVKAIDADKGTITVTITNKKTQDTKDVDFTVTDDTKVGAGTGMAALKDSTNVKVGDNVDVVTDDAGKVQSVMLHKGKKKPQ